ncbi:hypothetical protein [Ramlibacter algicola]|uniref:Uncharacterized protein n=1 Tax=Ramlibacter algicola TaxID=2795217 RepID=A0A934URD9_9BURK|nr:hypothetical protein [Ramlibacter algicola]MBK0392588.1 hypothetical protein [Ramlibacter algicola]
MHEPNPWSRSPAWIANARSWLSERGRLRRDADELARMEWRELRDIGITHSRGVESGILMTPSGPVARRSWIDAQPFFPGRAIRR